MPISQDDILSLIPLNDFRPGLQLKKDLGLENFQNVVIQKAINFPLPLYVVTYNSRYPERAIFYSKVKNIKTSFIKRLRQYGVENKFKSLKLTPPVDLNYFTQRLRTNNFLLVRDMAGEQFVDDKMFTMMNESLVVVEEESKQNYKEDIKNYCLFTGNNYELPAKKLIENILNPDYVKQIIHNIQKHKYELTHAKTNESFIHKLNDILVLDNIYFTYNKLNTNMVYRGGFYKKTGEIEIQVGNAIGAILKDETNFNSFLLKVKEIIGHELIHRLQFIKDNEKSLEPESYASVREYLSSPFEIMSFAWQIVEWHRNEGMDDLEIKRMLQRKNSYKYRNGVLDKFHEIFSFSDAPLRLLYKYMYMYLDVKED